LFQIRGAAPFWITRGENRNVAKVQIEGNTGSLIGRLLQNRLRIRREIERFGDAWATRASADHLAERTPFPRESEGPGAGKQARQSRFSSLPGPLKRYTSNLPAWW
jgi:hypothetical protein